MAMTIPQFADPLILLLISPVVLAGLYFVRKGISKPLVISRVIILSFLIIALASPFTIGTSTVRDEAPHITVLSDQTMSMDLFNMDTGQKIFEALKSKTPTKQSQFAGIKSPIGDEVVTASENNNIVLVSDGNSNYGKDLSDAISFVSNTGTRVFAVKQAPVHNDASVEIESAKNLIVGNENVFNIVVRQAGNETGYKLDVEIDGKNVRSEDFVQQERTKVIPISATFSALGTHNVKATITPGSEDRFNLNNVFYKSVYVVPKPKIFAVTDDTTSPLFTIANSLYDVKTANSVPDNVSEFKALIIDNKGAAQLSADTLRTYVGGGGGLVVVGGDSAYDKGIYNNSPVEAILPIISRAAEYKGGNNLVVIMDASGSTAGEDPTTKLSFIGLIDANAMNIVQNVARDTSLGVVAFGGTTAQTDLLKMGNDANKDVLNQFINDIGPKGGDNPTDLDNGLRAAEKMLNSVSGTKEVIVLSDGMMPPDGFSQIEQTVKELVNADIKIHFVQILLSYQAIKEPNKLYDDLAKAANGEAIVLNPDERASTLIENKPGESPAPTPAPTPEVNYEFPLTAVDSNHFITKYVNLTASVTGYNDVTPKLGADRLVATTRGKPILTTWGFGLGRVASFTTDNGGGLTMWAPAVYSGENSRLISGMINWAIGDPRPGEGVVIQADDIWAGTPGKVVVTSNTLPQVQLDKTPLDLSRTGPATYETTINPENDGFHDLSGYGIAVNYPLEYRDVGFNENLITAIESNGGRVYDEKEIESLLLVDIKEKAVRTVSEPESMKEPFLLAALILFLLEVIIRRMKDYRKERPVIEENPQRAAAPVGEPVAGGEAVQ
ncbi:MAG: VWA domain-containing protein [Candidatus Methanoperedens sp.]|nr:VWA domain-containing protein [Candidatus Methanoperedens sp.]